jgi:hypothetical protein
LRRQALDWLREDLTWWAKKIVVITAVEGHRRSGRASAHFPSSRPALFLGVAGGQQK